MKHLKENIDFNRVFQEAYLEYVISRNIFLEALSKRPISDLRWAYKIYRDFVRILENSVSKEDKRDAYLCINKGIKNNIPDRKIEIKSSDNVEYIFNWRVLVKTLYQNEECEMVFNLYEEDKDGRLGSYFDKRDQTINLCILDKKDTITLYNLAEIFNQPETIIHEVTHYIDWLKDNNKIVPENKLISAHQYYNQEEEINGFTQQLLINIRNWFVHEADPKEQLELLVNPEEVERFIKNRIVGFNDNRFARMSDYDRQSLYNFWYQLTDENKKEVINQIVYYIKNALAKINIDKKESVEEFDVFEFFNNI